MQNSIIKKENWNPLQYRCKVCEDLIWSRREGQFTTCKCGAISIDQTRHYTRFIGESTNFIEGTNNVLL